MSVARYKLLRYLELSGTERRAEVIVRDAQPGNPGLNTLKHVERYILAAAAGTAIAEVVCPTQFEWRELSTTKPRRLPTPESVSINCRADFPDVVATEDLLAAVFVHARDRLLAADGASPQPIAAPDAL